ncbi:hypothetical protein M413DRAFT_202762 [Hebeloma cylindrosporum]|uniref:Uncharacterized protein n=1 Tax=Hebeloma cylindrosporum TaxID=76867 RepID=A0A0C2Z2P9_HEBCY|nr:hypothetical protein M413DRAFT_202762 [Hebeloma cylindrosporum h7]
MGHFYHISSSSWPTQINLTCSPALTSQKVITALHIVENTPDSPSMKHLIEYLNKAPVPITVLAVLSTIQHNTSALHFYAFT